MGPRRLWDRESVLAELRRWADEHDGNAPRYADWNSHHAKKRGIELEPGWPSTFVVERHLGSWRAGLQAAGLAVYEPERGCRNCGCVGCNRCSQFKMRHGMTWSPEAEAEVARRATERRHRARDERLRRLLAFRRSGMTNVEIARQVGLHPVRVAQRFGEMRRLGWDVPPSPYEPVPPRATATV